MEVKKAIKKVIALSAGAIMVGATVMGAMAADLKDYPSPFLNADKKFDGYIVVGEVAGTIDVIGAIDIANNLQAEAVLQTTVSGSASSGVSLKGDAWLVRSGDKKLELANSQSTAVAEDAIRNITTYIGASELEALKDGTFNDKTYSQYLNFDMYTTGFVQFKEYSDTDVQVDHFIIPNNLPIARYSLEFSGSSESDIGTSSGTTDTTGTYILDYEDKKIQILGREFTVVAARRSGGTTDRSVKLTLMSGSTKATLNQGEAATLKVGDKEYEVELTYVDSSDRASFVVDGKSTGKINVGDTYKLADGNKIGVSSVYYQALETGAKRATFFLGANDMVIWDTNIEDTVSSKNLYTDGTSTSVSDATVQITGTDDNTTFKIDTIEVNMTSGDDYYVAPGEKLSDVIVARGDKAAVLFGENWDIEYHGLVEEEIEEINIENSGDSKYVLSFIDGSNNKADLPVGVVSGDTYYMGDTYSVTAASARHTILNESIALLKNDFFVITDESLSDGSRKSHVLQYKGSEKYTSDDTTPTMSFKDIGSGNVLEVSHKRGSTVYLKHGGGSFIVENASDDTSNDFNVKVDMDADGTVLGDDLIHINTKSGAKMVFSAEVDEFALRQESFGSGINITLTTPDSDDYENLEPTDLVYQLSATGSSDQVTMTRKGGLVVTAPTGDTENSYGMNSMGALVHLYSPTSGRPRLFIDYPKAQALPQVYITSGAVEESTTTSGGDLCDDVVPINVGAAKLDSEVKDQIGKKNLIVLGGPCANTVAAELMGNPDPCRVDFKEGESMIKLFDNSGKVSMLVAGYDGPDTRKAAEIVANHADVSGFEGMEITVKTVDGSVTKIS